MFFDNPVDELKFKIMRQLVPQLDNSMTETSMPYFDIESGIRYQVDLRQDNETGWQIERVVKLS
ncbi:hypothetical protein [Olivibacter sitiensis]|uniref:hypothetical protein n=1 Tax=Olivibacter sitiensis TaxID=376470 RepID=UPI000404B63E|nr:hypothetical protein [Olivibacter sitiensis]